MSVFPAFWAFLAVATLLILAPGPDSLIVMRHTMRRGWVGGFATLLGTMTGLSLWAVAAVLGLASLVEASQIGYDVLRIGGAVYLVWLGIVSLRSRGQSPDPLDEPGDGEPTRRLGLARMYVLGTLSDLLNPKIGVFFVAFLPGFVPAGAPVASTLGLLGAVFVVETGLYLVVLSALVVRGASWLRRPNIRRTLDRITGVVLIGFGIRLATESRAAV